MNQVNLEEIILDFKNKVDKADNKYPTKLFGPNLEQVLNAAGFYKKKEWVGLTYEEMQEILLDPKFQLKPLIAHAVEVKLKEKNGY